MIKSLLAVSTLFSLVALAQQAPVPPAERAAPAPAAAAPASAAAAEGNTAPAVEEPKKPAFDPAKYGIVAKHLYDLGGRKWFKPEAKAALEQAVKDFPEDIGPKLYLARFAALSGDHEAAGKVYAQYPSDTRSHIYQLLSHLEAKQEDQFVKRFDSWPVTSPSFMREHRLSLALAKKDLPSIERTINATYARDQNGRITRLVEFGVKLGNIQWAYDKLGEIAVSVPADEKGQVVLARIFAEREKLKLLFPEKIK